MSTWRRAALSFLPEYRRVIESAATPMAMWVDLQSLFDDAFAHQESDRIARFLRFAAWCVSERSGQMPDDTSTAAITAFYEHLPLRRAYWEHFAQWFSPSEFQTLLPAFGYHLDERELASLKAAFERHLA